MSSVDGAFDSKVVDRSRMKVTFNRQGEIDSVLVIKHKRRKVFGDNLKLGCRITDGIEPQAYMEKSA